MGEFTINRYRYMTYRNYDLLISEWSKCKKWLEAALEFDTSGYTIDEIFVRIVQGKSQFWPGKNSAIVTEVLTSPKYTCINYWLAGGDKEELLEMEKEISEYAVNTWKCTRASIKGRGGWERVLKNSGFSKVATLLEKEL
jgi:hypothetical protein